MTSDYTVTIDKILNYLKKTQLLLYNTELNDLGGTICLRKSEVFVERISVCNVIEKFVQHGIHCLLCCGTNNIIYLLSKQPRVHTDV